MSAAAPSPVPQTSENAALLHTLDRALAWHQVLRDAMVKLGTAFTSREVSPRLSAPWNHFVAGMHDHLKVEEELLFPAVRALAEGRNPGRTDFEAPLQEMQFEMDEIATIGDALRNAAPEAGDLEADLLEMLDQLDQHAAREQEVIFPAAVRLLAAWRTGAPGPAAASADRTAAPPPPAARPPGPAPRQSAGHEPSLLFRVLRRFGKLIP